MIADATGRAVAFRLTLGQAYELPQAVPLLDLLLGVPLWVAVDRGYSGHRFRQHVRDAGAKPAVPTQRNEAPRPLPGLDVQYRNRVACLWAQLKEWRAVPTRYEKTATSFTGVLCLAAACDRIS